MKFEYETGSGVKFIYDNSNNALYKPDGTMLSLPYDGSADQYKDRYGRLDISREPETIKILLGQACNYSCSYCVQKDIGNPNDRGMNGMTPILISKLKRVFKNLDSVTRIELWGGETLLYWNDIIELMTAFDRDGITWYIPTNGTPLLDKHVDFFLTLKGKVTIGISHDGPGHEALRGKEFLHKKVDVLRRIQTEGKNKIDVGFNAVISNTNFDLFAIEKYFNDFAKNNNLNRFTLCMNLARAYDPTMEENSANHVITGDNIKKYAKILYSFLKQCEYEYLNNITDGLLINNLFHFNISVLEYAKTLKTEKLTLMKSSCGVDDHKLVTVNIDGNIRTCQNVDSNYNSGDVIFINGIKKKAINITRIDTGCSTCANNRLCKSSCPIEIDDEVFKANCAIEKVHYSTIQNTAFEMIFKDSVKYVKVVN